MKTLLLTGFGAFKDIEENPSLLLIEELQKSLGLPDEFRLVTEILPVVYDEASQRMRELIHEVKPDLLISFGVAASRDKINIERVALNLQDASDPDNAGVLKDGHLIDPDGPKAYFANFPLQEIKTVCENAGGATTISNHAGGYLCNEVFYTAAHEIAKSGLGTQYGFIHLPELAETTPKESEHDFDLNMLIEAIQAALQWLMEQPAEEGDK